MPPSKSSNILFISRTNGNLQTRVLERVQSSLRAFFMQSNEGAPLWSFNVFLYCMSTNPGCFPNYIIRRSAYIHNEFPIHEDFRLTSIASTDTVTSLVDWSRSLSSADSEILWMFGHGSGGEYPELSHTLSPARSPNTAALNWPIPDTSPLKLSINELEMAMNSIAKSSRGAVDILFMEACLFGQLETAHAAMRGARFLVSSSQWADIDAHQNDFWLSKMTHSGIADVTARQILASQAARAVAEDAAVLNDTRHRTHTGTVLALGECATTLQLFRSVIDLYSAVPNVPKIDPGMVDVWALLQRMIDTLPPSNEVDSLKESIYAQRLKFQISAYAAHDAAVVTQHTLSYYASLTRSSKLDTLLGIDRVLTPTNEA